MLLSAAVGCGGEDAGPGETAAPTAVVEASIQAQGNATSLMFAPIGDGEDDLLAITPDQLGIEVLFVEDGSWRVFGSAYTGKLPPAQAVHGRVDGTRVVTVRLEDQSVTLLALEDEPHRLSFPVQVYNKQSGASLVDIALGDLDGDGSDDLVVGEVGRIQVVTELSQALDAHPEKPPNLARQLIESDFAVGRVGVIDIDEDGDMDVLALSREEAAGRLYKSNGAGTFEASDVALPSIGASILSAGDCGWGALVVLANGAAVALDAAGVAGEASPELPAAARMAASPGGVAIASIGSRRVSMAGPCGEGAAEIGEAPPAADLALDPSRGASERLAILGQDRRTVTVMRVEAAGE
jgi:hypothetical protein